MSILTDLINQIDDANLKERISKEVDELAKQKKFGLVFEEHQPECTPLYEMPIKVGSHVAKKDVRITDVYTVIRINGNEIECIHKETKEVSCFSIDDMVVVAEFGEPIYPYLKPIDSICNAPDSDLWHTLIEADNYHALQLLEYLYAGRVDCIYIDPPYNTGARDWKYNNDYVDSSDQYRHSKWLSMMQKRLKIAKKLLNPKDSVLIVTIDEKEYLHLGCLLEELFPQAHMQMVSINIHPGGVARENEFARSDEYAYFVFIGSAGPACLELTDDWMFGIETTSRDGVHWRGLMRSGSDDARTDCPSLFYPIYVSEDGKRFMGAGEPLPLGVDRNTIVVPKGQTAIFPIHLDGTEGRWQYSKDRLLAIQEKGYVKLGGFTPRGMSISYLAEGEQKKVEDGLFKIVGKEEDGSLKLDDSEYSARFIPTTQWCIKSHDALRNGSNFIRKFFPDKRFDFPKSIYAVYDTIRFVVANKPDALILDFFAGSGTTLNAVNLLNAEDGGKRRCIMVTNNEVSAEESKTLISNGYKPGDTEWNNLGIARYVTWPRTRCSIIGEDVLGNKLSGYYGVEKNIYIPSEKSGHNGCFKKAKKQLYPNLAKIKFSDGFKANANFFQLGFLDKNSVALGRQFKELLPVLWMKAGAIGECPSIKGEIPDYLICKNNKMAVLINENAYIEFVENIDESIDTVFIVTDSEAGYRDMIKDLDVKNTYQLYRDYLDNFRINSVRR